MECGPKISIIIPVYNVALYLQGCLESVINQTLIEIEILCVDDGSTDGSFNILLDYVDRDPRIRIFQAADSQGAGPARNLAMRQARGEYIAFMDADDLYPNRSVLETLYTTAVRKDAKICGGSIVLLREDGTNASAADKTFLRSAMCSFQEYQFPFGFTRFLYLREMLLENNIFFPEYLRFEDPPFMAKAMLAAKVFFCIPDVVYVYRKGYKEVNWSLDKVCDCIQGVADVIETAKKYEFAIMCDLMVDYLLGAYFNDFYDKVGNDEVIAALKNVNAMIDLAAMREKRKKTMPFVQGKQVIVYGTGGTGKSVMPYLQHSAAALLGVCNSQTTTKQMWRSLDMELPLCGIQEWKQMAPDAMVLIATLEEHHDEIEKNCRAAGFQEIIPITKELRLAMLSSEYYRRFGN